MALSNRERIGKTMEIIAPHLDELISVAVAKTVPDGKDWTVLLTAHDARNGREPTTYYRLDPYAQLRFIRDQIPSKIERGWFPFRDSLPRAAEGYVSELLAFRNQYAHNKSFTADDAYRALDTAERLLIAIAAPQAADQVKALRTDLRRLSAEREDRRVLSNLTVSPESGGLRPWREVLRPHDDVATGRFQASEFAADLYKVATGDSGQTRDYSDPVEFFSRTFLTEGLRDLITRAVRRVSGDMNASPVINLQTNFGGGKTHSMLSLWHLAGGTPMTDYPQDVQELLEKAGFGEITTPVRRVAIVGNHLAPSGEQIAGGPRINTIWGKLAWELGGEDGYAIVAEADQSRTNPGKALHELLAKFAPAVILIDEWVAYARQLYNREDVAGGTFETQFTFAQTLTEAAKATRGILLAISIPASDVGDAEAPEKEAAAGSNEEVGGAHGVEALKRLQNVVRRVADQWRPASPDEAYHIVRQRLFVTPDAQAIAEIQKASKAFVDLYRQASDHFPREARDNAYEQRIRSSYPIHPELFDRLYEDWASLERFQRTRGVLRLMNAVIYALWRDGDAAPLIMPGSIPLSDASVNSEITGYLPDQWKSVIDADVDGPQSEPRRIDDENSLYGQRSVTKRLARTVFFGAAPTIGSAHKGIEKTRVFLGTAMPGDVIGNFHSALDRLADRATYFYVGMGKYWYDLQANITRRAKDQADRLHINDVHAEISRRLQDQSRQRAQFARVHVCPERSDDIVDLAEARLVILHPRLVHAAKSKDSTAMQFAHEATEHRGTAQREFRNMVVYLAADARRMEELEYAVRDYVGWSEVLDQAAELDLSPNQRQQAESRRTQADKTVTDRLIEAYQWVLEPAAPIASQPFVIDERKADGSAASLAERVAKKMIAAGSLSTQQAVRAVRFALQNHVPALWARGRVSIGELWDIYAKHPYMPRLLGRDVLVSGLTEQPMLWQADGFALAAGYDEDTDTYAELWLPDSDETPPALIDSTLLVTPEVAVSWRAAHPVAPVDDAGAPAPGPSGAGLEGSQAGGRAGEADTSTNGWLPGGDKPIGPVAPARPNRYVAAVDLGKQPGVDFLKINDEILEHLLYLPDAKVTLTLDISAEVPGGFSETTERVLRENGAALRFTYNRFETE